MRTHRFALLLEGIAFGRNANPSLRSLKTSRFSPPAGGFLHGETPSFPDPLSAGSIPTSLLSAKKTKRYHKDIFLFWAGAEGIEPSLAVLETDVIPFHYAPIEQTPPRRGFDHFLISLC